MFNETLQIFVKDVEPVTVIVPIRFQISLSVRGILQYSPEKQLFFIDGNPSLVFSGDNVVSVEPGPVIRLTN